MRKLLTFVMLISLFSFGYMVANSYADMEPMARGLDRPYEVSRLVGSYVTNGEKEYLGSINDFVLDNGRISFAVLSHGGFLGIGRKLVAIPFSAFSYDSTDQHFILDISRDRLEAAPRFDRSTDLTNREWAEDVYKFFGLQPYWTEGEYEGVSSTIEEPMREETMQDFPSTEAPYYREYGPDYLWP